MLTKEQILAKSTLKKEKVIVKEWGGEVYITELTVSEFNQINALMMGDTEIDSNDKKISLTIGKFADVKSLTLSLGVVNEDGSKMFTKDEIGNLSSNNDSLDFLYEKINGLNNPKKK